MGFLLTKGQDWECKDNHYFAPNQEGKPFCKLFTHLFN